MRIIYSATRLFTLIVFCAAITEAQKPANPSAVRSNYELYQKLLIVADNQEHLLTGAPLRSMSPLSERFITSVALRSPLANVGGRLLFREFLRFGKSQGVGLVLHLGDAADISCPDELTSVFDALDQETPGIWFMTPGNHDGLLAGNLAGYQPPLDFKISEEPSFYKTGPLLGYGDDKYKWLNACLSPTNYMKKCSADIMTRGDAIRLYVKRLKLRQDTPPKPPEELTVTMTGPEGSKIDVTCTVEKIEIKSAGYSAYARICERKAVPGDPKKRWVGAYASFIVQKLDVYGTRIILLDTSDYIDATAKLKVAFRGEITNDQQEQADLLLDRENIERKNVIIAGHHPLANLSQRDREWVIERSGRYISAHVHSSTSLIPHKVKNKKTLELNVGSTLDYPPQAVIANLTPTAMLLRVVGEGSSDTLGKGFLKECDDRRGDWMFEPSFYNKYKTGNYMKHLLDALGAASARHTKKVISSLPPLEIPDGTKASDWLLLDRALQSINETHGKSRTFWACQAYYASEVTRVEKSLWEKVPKFGWGFKKGTDATGGWLPFSAP